MRVTTWFRSMNQTLEGLFATCPVWSRPQVLLLAVAMSTFQPGRLEAAGGAEMGARLVEALRAAVQEKGARGARRQVRAARELAEQGADVNVRGEQQRTALHWVAIGAKRFDNRKLQREYRALAELLIERGAEVNAEDAYGNTALDWEEANPEESLHYILLQAGAEHGVSHNDATRMVTYLNRLRGLAAESHWPELAAALDADVPAGTEIWVRLTEAFHSKNSRSGDKISGVVIAPVRNGERVVIEPGTRVEGTVLAARPARNRYNRAEAALDFTNFHHSDGSMSRLATRVAEVDNARETVTHGRIVGVPFPNEVVGKWTLGLRGLGFVMPGLSEGLRWSTLAYNATLGREIDYAPGTELILRVAVPERLNTSAAQRDWKRVEAAQELVRLVQSQPMRVQTQSGQNSDLINLMFIGAAEDLEAAFREAGWLEARNLNLTSGFRTVLAAMRRRGYEEAPFSRLLLEGKAPDYEYQKDLNTVAKRHHLRIYRREHTYLGQTVWLASATHDIGIGAGRAGTRWYHIVDSNIDRERQKIADDLLFTGIATAYSMVERPGAPRVLENATGDVLRTDGQVLVLYLTQERKGGVRLASLGRAAGGAIPVW